MGVGEFPGTGEATRAVGRRLRERVAEFARGDEPSRRRELGDRVRGRDAVADDDRIRIRIHDTHRTMVDAGRELGAIGGCGGARGEVERRTGIAEDHDGGARGSLENDALVVAQRRERRGERGIEPRLERRLLGDALAGEFAQLQDDHGCVRGARFRGGHGHES